MTDERPTASENSPREPPRTRRNIPPLVWIVLLILVGWLVIALLQRGGYDRTPQGGTAPRQAEGPAYMPPAPATGSAPATPGGQINGPQQPVEK